MTLSTAFHLASGIGLLVMLWVLVLLRSRITLLRRWASPKTSGVLVGEPLGVLKSFADACGIKFLGDDLPRLELARVSLRSVFGLHFRCGIEEMTLLDAKPPTVSFKIHGLSDTMSEDQRQIETDFANSFQVKISSSPKGS